MVANIDKIIRVNQAGEYGATRIYAGQLAILKNSSIGPTLQEMQLQEQYHLKTFNELAIEQSTNPTIFQPIWHVGGYLLGAATAILGEKAAHACTIAVEEVIADHYAAQINQLNAPEEGELRDTIIQFRADELSHKDHAVAEGGLSAPGYEIISTAVKAISRAAIWLSEKI